MRVILLKNTPKIGKKYEVKEVASGYANNFLIPNGLAKAATAETLQWAKKQRVIAAKTAEGELEKIAKIVQEMEGLEVEIPAKIGDKGQLFEKVTQQKIAAKLKEMGYNIAKDQIEISQTIDGTGDYDAKVVFDHNLESNIKVVIVEDLS